MLPGTPVTTPKPCAACTATARWNAATFTGWSVTSPWRRRSTTDRCPNRACLVGEFHLCPTTEQPASLPALLLKPCGLSVKDRVVDDLNPVLNFTRKEVESLLHFVEEEPETEKISLESQNEYEEVMFKACQLYPNLITKVPMLDILFLKSCILRNLTVLLLDLTAFLSCVFFKWCFYILMGFKYSEW